MAYGTDDLARAAARLAAQLPEPLAPLARVAYNYRWSWEPYGHETFRVIDPARYERVGGNPVRLLTEADADAIQRAGSDPAFVERVAALARAVEDDLARPFNPTLRPEHP